MAFRCKNSDGHISQVTWLWIKNAWLAAVTVCHRRLYSYTPATEPECNEGESLCDDICVDLNTDRDNCGECGNACEEDQECIDGECVTLIPTVTTDDLNMFGVSASITGTVVSEGASSVIEYGFVYSLTDPPTLDDTVITTGSGPFTGEFDDNTDSMLEHGETYYFRAYATNSEGTGYGESLSDMAFICLIRGTKITLSNGSQKSIEEITYDDDLLVWNFDEAKLDSAKPVWIAKEFSMPNYRVNKFSDGSELGSIEGLQAHCIFNHNQGKFTYLNSETLLGTNTFNEKGETISLTGCETVRKEISFHNIITNRHINLFANGILTSSKLNNIYPIENMQFVKNSETRNTTKFNVSGELYYGLRLDEQPASYKGLEEKIAMMVSARL